MPPATPAAIHHSPRPLWSISASVQRSTAAAAICGASGVATSASTPTIGMKLKAKAASAAPYWFFKTIAAVRQTASVAGIESSQEKNRTPKLVSPKIAVPARMRNAISGG